LNIFPQGGWVGEDGFRKIPTYLDFPLLQEGFAMKKYE
jgi:hypothetical protein